MSNVTELSLSIQRVDATYISGEREVVRIHLQIRSEIDRSLFVIVNADIKRAESDILGSGCRRDNRYRIAARDLSLADRNGCRVVAP